MTQAQIQINTVSGSNPPNGTLVTPGSVIGLNNLGTGGESTWLWEFLDLPPGSLAAFSNATIQSPTFTADCEGTYLIRVTVNLGIGGEKIDTAILGVSQIRSRLRVPAALETTQYGLKGWSQAVNASLRLLDRALADSNRRIGVVVGAPVTRGRVVKQTSNQLVLTGLPYEELVAGYELAVGTSAADVSGTLFAVEGGVDGSSSVAIGGLVVVRAGGLIGPLAPTGLVPGTDVYLADTSLMTAGPGTLARRLGRVITTLDANDWIQFDGSAGGGSLGAEPIVFASAPTGTYPRSVNLAALRASLEIVPAADVNSLSLRRFTAAQASALFRLRTQGGADLFSVSPYGDITFHDPDATGARGIQSLSSLALNANAGSVLFQVTGVTVWRIDAATDALIAVGAQRPIQNVLDPVTAQDVSTKNYTDTHDFTTLVFGNTALPNTNDNCVLDPGFGIRTAPTVAAAASPGTRVTRTGTLKRLFAHTRASSTVVNTDLEVWVDSGAGYAATTIVCTFTAGATNESKGDAVHTFPVVAGDRVQLRSKPGGVPGVGCLDITASLELIPT